MKATLWLGLVLLALSLVELGAHAATRAAVPGPDDFRNAAAFVRSELRQGDLLTSAPAWTDPLLRAQLGDRVDFAMAGRSDTAAYARLWSLSIRGARAPEATGLTPVATKVFGGVHVELYELARPTVVHDLTRMVAQAEVSLGGRPCVWKRSSQPRGGGLGAGVLPPLERFACDAQSTWVAETVLEDLDLQPRHCVHQPPGLSAPTRVTLRDVELSDALVVYAGLYYEDERMRRGEPVTLRVLAGDAVLGTLTHRDGDAWKRMQLATRPGPSDLTFEVQSTRRKQRRFCWAASVRKAAP